VPPPQLVNISPAGGQAGSSFEVTVTGQNLDSIEGLYFSTPGIQAELVRPMEAATKVPKGKKPPPKTMAPKNRFTFKLTLAENAHLGVHDVRAITKGGISNPRPLPSAISRRLGKPSRTTTFPRRSGLRSIPRSTG
jgi:hypothetical protein